MKILSYGKDGGKDSCVWGYWLIELKSLFSVVLLCFEDGSREEYHSHAFNCWSWVLKGQLRELNLDGSENTYKPSIFPIKTKRETFHKVFSEGRTWVFSIRGAWFQTWREFLPATKQYVTLRSGREVVGIN